MFYESETLNSQVNELFDELDVRENTQSFRLQILESTDDDGFFSSQPVNLLESILSASSKVENLINISDEHKITLRDNIDDIYAYVINAISEKFNFEIDDQWLSYNGKFGSIANTLYLFFIMDFFHNSLTFVYNYILENKEAIVDMYKDTDQTNVSSLANSKHFTYEDAIICTNITNITKYAYQMISSETVFSYLPDNYIPGLIIRDLYGAGNLNGDFFFAMKSIYDNSLALQSKLGFELIFKFKQSEDSKGEDN